MIWGLLRRMSAAAVIAITPAPICRTEKVPAESRSFSVLGLSRTFVVAPQSRVFVVPAEPRAFTTECRNRNVG